MRRGRWVALALALVAGCSFDGSGLPTADPARAVDAAGADVGLALDIAAEPTARDVGFEELAGPDAPGPDAPGPDAVQPDAGLPDVLSPLPLGAPCVDSVQCTSGQCVKQADGVGKICCDSACFGCSGCENNGQGCDC